MEQSFPAESLNDGEVPMRFPNPLVPSGVKRRSRSLVALDALNFFQADVHGGVGPFMVTFLATSLHWTPDRIGLVMFASGILGLCAQAPCGALVDQLKLKRLIVAVSAALIGLACIAIVQVPSFPMILAGQSFIALAGACFGPAIAAISIGLVGRNGINLQVGRNASVSSAGNVAMAVAAGLIGYLMGNSAIFFFVAIMSTATIASVMLIREDDIDQAVARGADDHGSGPRIVHIRHLFWDRRLAIFALCAVLFHFANAAVLPLGSRVCCPGTERQGGSAGDVLVRDGYPTYNHPDRARDRSLRAKISAQTSLSDRVLRFADSLPALYAKRQPNLARRRADT
jgi:MFS family permease